MWLFGYEFWIVPNLWSDTAAIYEAFSPLYTFAKSEQQHVRGVQCRRGRVMPRIRSVLGGRNGRMPTIIHSLVS
jgi:hypothetical protein